MPLIKQGELVSDQWVFIEDSEEEGFAPLPEQGDIVVSLSRFLEEKDSLKARKDRLGVRLEAGEEPLALADEVEALDLITVDFPAFKDGRGYSYARLLRERYGYRGELRAVGNVLRDQLLYMWRCGFDAFQVNQAVTPEVFREALGEMSVIYQPTGVNSDTVMSRRHS